MSLILPERKQGGDIRSGPVAAAASPASLHWFPLAWIAACVVVLGLAFLSISWPYIDVHNNLREATTWSWPQYARYAFSRGVEYRPLLTLAIKAAYQMVGAHLWVYQTLVLAQFCAVLALLLWLFRPLGARRGLAAVIALSCIVGLHTSRILFLFVPLNAYSGSLVLLLAATALAFAPRTRAMDWIFFPLAFASFFLLESSLLVIPVLVVLWWLRAPGIGLRGVAAVVLALAGYGAVRLLLGGPVSLESSYVGSGLGFSGATPETLRNVFEHAPWLFWVYNVVASFLTVVLSEPRAGVYRFVASLLGGEAPVWQWLHVISSLVTSALVAGSFIVFRPTSHRDRLLAATGLVLLVLGSGLGFLYTRDRIGLFAGVGYAMLVYVAFAMLFERRGPAEAGSGVRQGDRPFVRRPLVRHGVTAAVAFVVVAWTVRVGEAYTSLRDTAWDYHLEWTDRYAALGGALREQTPLLLSLRSAALATTPADPQQDPAWTYALFERQFSPSGQAHTTADAAADNTVMPLSLPFDIRWKAEVDEATRRQLESELGLTGGQQVARDPRGRTWEYRLSTPTRDRVRAVVVHAAVEDTGRIDVQRFEVVQ